VKKQPLVKSVVLGKNIFKNGNRVLSGVQLVKPGHRLLFSTKIQERYDGKNNKCKSCSRAKDRQRYKPVPLDLQKPRGFAVHPPRDGDKQQARNRVNREVAKGKLPHARTVPCTDCGHIGSDRLHEYDHYLGYASINHWPWMCLRSVPQQTRTAAEKTGKVNEN
jgi:hypothetical protein